MKTSSSYKLRHIVSLILCALFAGVFVGVTYADGQGMIALLDSVDLDDVVSWTLEEEPATYPYFYVNVTITNVTDVISAPFSVHWDPTILSLTDIIQGNFLEPPGTGGISSPSYMVNYTAGYLEDYAYTQLYPFAPKSFPATTWGLVANLTFEFIGTSPTADFPIDTDIVFVNEQPNRPTYWAAWEAGKLVKHSFAQMLPCHFHYEAPQEHDVAVTSVVPSTFEVFVGDSVDINVTVKNEGNVEESFTVNLYAGVDLVGTETATLAAGATGTYTFTWTTTAVGNFTIRAEVPAVPDEVDTDDNTWTSTLWRIEVIPEFPTLMPLLLVLAVLAVSTIVLMRRTSNTRLTRRLR